MRLLEGHTINEQFKSGHGLGQISESITRSHNVPTVVNTILLHTTSVTYMQLSGAAGRRGNETLLISKPYPH